MKNENIAPFIFLFFIVSSVLILYPQNFKELFYYDDNPIRYMIAKRWVENRLPAEDKKFFLSFGSAELYIPFFYIAKYFKVNYKFAYNIISFVFFFLGLIYLFVFLPKEERGVLFVLPLFVLFGIVCMKKGSMHWFISSSIMMSAIISYNLNVLHILSLGVAYFISPPLVVLVLLFSLILLYQGEKKKALFIVLPIVIALPKMLLVGNVTSDEIRKALIMVNQVGTDAIGITHFFVPPDYQMFFRLLILDYIDNPIPIGISVYLILVRSLLTKDRFSLFLFLAFYAYVFVSLIFFRMWKEGYNISEAFVFLILLTLSSNPFRYAPIFVSYLILRSDKRRYDAIFGGLIIFLFLLASVSALIRGSGELPKGVPFDVKLLNYILANMDGKNVLVEGDIHMFSKGRLVHPLYNSHILSYISAEVENKNFYGGIFPWELHTFNFFAGKFRYADLEKSDIHSFIKEKEIDIVLCWTDVCKRFFSNGIFWDIGRFCVVKLQ